MEDEAISATSTSKDASIDTIEKYNTVDYRFTDEEKKEERKGPKFSSTTEQEQENEKGRSDFKVTFSEKRRQRVRENSGSYKLTMNNDEQDWCDEVVLWYHLDFYHSIRREGTFVFW